MNPVIIEVKEGVRLGPGNIPVAVLNVKWTVGTFGPFIEQSTWNDLSNGKLMDALHAKALKLGQLPVPAQTA